MDKALVFGSPGLQARFLARRRHGDALLTRAALDGIGENVKTEREAAAAAAVPWRTRRPPRESSEESSNCFFGPKLFENCSKTIGKLSAQGRKKQSHDFLE